ncbi:MAG: hypothetical protein J0H09_18235 [Burkholderiales bacterium]|nr:hypothetical protein [Burkholderiales bacterium]
MLSSTAYTGKTIASTRALIKHLDEVREQGFAVSDEERDEGVWGIGTDRRRRSLPLRAFCRGAEVPNRRLAAPGNHRDATRSGRGHQLATVLITAGQSTHSPSG